MKIELIKETNELGKVEYWTRVDGKYVNTSIATSEEAALKSFEEIKKELREPKLEILKSETI